MSSPSPTVIISGASRGLGAATARLLAEMGANVVLNARSEDDLRHLAASLRAAGAGAAVAPGDIREPSTAAQAVAQALDRFGRLDAIINNAGILEPLARIAQANAQAWLDNLAINVIGPVLLTQAALPHLRETGGRVINVSSGAAVRPKAGWAAYCTAKAALNMFNEALALEEPEIVAIAVRPGVVDTEMQAVIRREGQSHMTDDQYERFVSYHERGELQPPEKPGRALAVLALYAPRELSGAFVNWTDERVTALIDQHGG